MSDELITGSVHGDLTTSGIERGRAREGLASGTLEQGADKTQLSKPHSQRGIFHKALEQAATREREQRRSLSIDEVQAEIWKVINEFHITGPGVTGQGTSWSVHPPEPKTQGRASDSAAIPKHPFKVLDASAGGVDKVKTFKDSFLYTTTDLSSSYSISGLNTATSVSAGNKVYLAITTNSSLTVTAAVNTIGAVWSGYGAMYHIDSSDPDNPFVDTIYVLIAEIVAVADTRDGSVISGTGMLKIIQHWRNNIMLFAYPDAAGIPTYIPLSV